ncbi:MAG: glycosyltransferase family 2 protein [Henriciella sp.]
MPKCSIITINYNCATELMETLASIAALTSGDFETIVVDGYSKDGSDKVMEDFSFLIDKPLSEPDRGIYDAMNKGLELAEGEYVIFMNSGDSFHDPEVMSRIPFGDADVIYGKAYSMQSGQEWAYNDQLWKGMICSHQATFFRTALVQELKFSEKYRIVADYDLYVRLANSGATFLSVDTPVARIDTSGVSFSSFEERTMERLDVCRTYYPGQAVRDYFRELFRANGCEIPKELEDAVGG